jgi:hypothetical protein
MHVLAIRLCCLVKIKAPNIKIGQVHNTPTKIKILILITNKKGRENPS